MTSSGKMRIYELSRDLGLDNKDVLDAAEKLAIPARSHSSSISDEEATRIRALIRGQDQAGGASAPQGGPGKTILSVKKAPGQPSAPTSPPPVKAPAPPAASGGPTPPVPPVNPARPVVAPPPRTAQPTPPSPVRDDKPAASPSPTCPVRQGRTQTPALHQPAPHPPPQTP